MLYEVMPDDMRAADPLLAACRFVEEKDARVPGFGDRLYEFVTPFRRCGRGFPTPHSGCLSITRCQLARPSRFSRKSVFRNRDAFESGWIKTLGTRVFGRFATAPLSQQTRRIAYSDLFPLLSDTQIEQAEILGKAMRIGAMLWVKDNKKRAALSWNEVARELVLELSQKNADLFGEVCAARLGSLASTLNASSKLLLV